jgi:hypothetical protein
MVRHYRGDGITAKAQPYDAGHPAAFRRARMIDLLMTQTRPAPVPSMPIRLLR